VGSLGRGPSCAPPDLLPSGPLASGPLLRVPWPGLAPSVGCRASSRAAPPSGRPGGLRSPGLAGPDSLNRIRGALAYLSPALDTRTARVPPVKPALTSGPLGVTRRGRARETRSGYLRPSVKHIRVWHPKRTKPQEERASQGPCILQASRVYPTCIPRIRRAGRSSSCMLPRPRRRGSVGRPREAPA
jgi:hypothetical protein